MVTRGEVAGGMGEIGDGVKDCTCWDEHKVMYGTAESLYSTPETNITLYINSLEFK